MADYHQPLQPSLCRAGFDAVLFLLLQRLKVLVSSHEDIIIYTAVSPPKDCRLYKKRNSWSSPRPYQRRIRNGWDQNFRKSATERRHEQVQCHNGGSHVLWGSGVSQFICRDTDKNLGHGTQDHVGELPPNGDGRNTVAIACVISTNSEWSQCLDREVKGFFISVERDGTNQGLVSYTRYWTTAPMTPDIAASKNPNVIRLMRPNLIFLRAKKG